NDSFPDLPLSRYCDAGLCAQIGVEQALLAVKGSTGFADILDGRSPFWKLYGASGCNNKVLTAGLKAIWHIGKGAMKPWPGARFTHYPLTALERLKAKRKFTADQIESINVRIGESDTAPPIWIGNPNNEVSAQFSIQHALAMSLLEFPPTSEWYSEKNLNKKDVKRLRNKIKVFTMEKSNEKFSASGTNVRDRIRPTILEVQTAYETYRIAIDRCKGDQWNRNSMMTKGEIIGKFRRLASFPVREDSSRVLVEIERTIDQLDRVKLRKLTRLLSSIRFRKLS
ncbi:MAG: MmgE/PrpD family protein, partial [Thaumarchaeota archaeon]|nr:MmgE/PrpD family protein [Nitrososphaerota archaeon]